MKESKSNLYGMCYFLSFIRLPRVSYSFRVIVVGGGSARWDAAASTQYTQKNRRKIMKFWQWLLYNRNTDRTRNMFKKNHSMFTTRLSILYNTMTTHHEDRMVTKPMSGISYIWQFWNYYYMLTILWLCHKHIMAEKKLFFIVAIFTINISSSRL